MYSLPDGYTAVTGEIIQASQHNPPLEDLESAMSARLMRSGVAPMTGPLKISDGAVGSPAVQFNSASSTGFYKTTNGIGVSIGGTKVAEFTSSGVSRMLGELIPWTRLSAPAGWVLPYGQTLSRTTYADLWAIAQTEIAAGNTFFNNGDGTTTFGIGDLRGRVVAGKDNMGGSAAGRLTTTSVLGGTAGSESKAIVLANLPPYTPSGSVANGGTISIPNALNPLQCTGGSSGCSSGIANGSGSSIGFQVGTTALGSGVSSTFTGAAQGGSSAPFIVLQPTMVCNYILYVGA